MTRRRKFEVGDLVVLKKSVKVEPFPSLGSYYYSGTSAERAQAASSIALRTDIKNVVRRVQSYNPSIRAGAIGLVRSFGNVFMLEFDKITRDQYKALPFARKDKDALAVGSDILLNRSNRKHMHVLIDEMLVAFAPGAKLFEKGEEALARYESVVVKFEGSIVFDRVNEIELKDRLNGKQRQLKAMFDTNRIISVECLHRDGTVETKEGSDGVTIH